MFSRLDPYFKTIVRQAETTDTRMAIQREEKQEGHKKKDDETYKAKDNSMWEDSAGVSVVALRTFLINFLKDLPQEQGSDAVKTAYVPEGSEKKPHDSKTAKALQAYHTMSAHTHPEEMAYTAGTAAAEPNITLKSHEVRLIHQLIADLEKLSKRGIETLTLQPAASFLESIEAGIKVTE